MLLSTDWLNNRRRKRTLAPSQSRRTSPGLHYSPICVAQRSASESRAPELRFEPLLRFGHVAQDFCSIQCALEGHTGVSARYPCDLSLNAQFVSRENDG